ncbi:SDR family oxidoreductase [Cereibacter azotoformans]|uniref:Nucleoside-diphosphate-sugar epimerase n=1 Tax=Cereibacter azotoformans TaxID=43057 RepID=A0A2T5K887_9RHOB|nr:SDR family oxidoreductase [Cereibacter azotoformans]AXQ94974.1 SDR family oxidoreductase [Cereibacter sphaeroides]MBO4170141.1 SDR family oxidoreductase [Cereibacter azotoformans]PTR18598.1 nucleoside-diphosphate-sugar epimerase [Cereibacter azotoformans]UIJ30562.1 SDR family oxidoreductase [Cereibacter azotoformans]
MTARLLVLGSTGRIGCLLRRAWQEPPEGLSPVWHGRGASSDLAWDMLSEAWPGGRADIVLTLAGVTSRAGRLEDNGALGMAGCRAAEAAGARHVFLLSSGAVYGSARSEDLSEEDEPRPDTPYGEAKLTMERAALEWRGPGRPGLTILRLGNVAGADALLGPRRAPGEIIVLDPVPGAGGPVRTYIGPVSLADVLARLARLAIGGAPLPEVLNLGAAPPVDMADLLEAAGLAWRWDPPRDGVIPRVSLALGRLAALCPMPADAGAPARLVAEWRALA